MSSPSSAACRSPSAHRYLTFWIDREVYGVPVLGVREIIRLPEITRVAQLPGHVRGVLNLRGRIIPVIDMRRRFGLAASDDHGRTCVVVVEVSAAGQGSVPMGLVVDAVDDVVQIGVDEIGDAPEFGGQVDTSFLVGLAKVKGAVIALLDLERALRGVSSAPTLFGAAAHSHF